MNYPKKRTYFVVAIAAIIFLGGAALMDARHTTLGGAAMLVGALTALAGICGDL